MSGHHHSGEGETTVRGASAVLLCVVLPLAALTLFGLITLWPSGDGPQDSRFDATYGTPGSQVVVGAIAELETFACPRGDEGPSGRALTCSRARIRLEDADGARPRTVTVDLPPGSHQAGAAVGDRVRLLRAPVGEEGAKTDYYAFVDFYRDPPMLALAIAYALVVVLVARMRGLRALLGLVLAFGVLATFMLPALLEGKPPLLVGLTGSSAIMLVVLYFAHGLSARTTTALLGTLAGLAVTAILGAWATGAARLTGTGSEESGLLQSGVGSLDLSAVLLCGIVLAGLGVLNDVTITQASAVWELHALSPTMSARRLFAGAMRIGRDHIASTVYTIAFAYAGAALPTLLLLELYQRPVLIATTSGELAEEVVRTLVGSIGLVLAIPLTTAVAVAVVKAADRHTQARPRKGRAGNRREDQSGNLPDEIEPTTDHAYERSWRV
ncbi:MAG TPA: YibE/F family protein [Actinopolymorphaceae bacterium]